MTIPLGPLQLRVTLARARRLLRIWEEHAAVGMDDSELAHLNVRNTRVAEEAVWEQRQHLLVDCMR